MKLLKIINSLTTAHFTKKWLFPEHKMPFMLLPMLRQIEIVFIRILR